MDHFWFLVFNHLGVRASLERQRGSIVHSCLERSVRTESQAWQQEMYGL